MNDHTTQSLVTLRHFKQQYEKLRTLNRADTHIIEIEQFCSDITGFINSNTAREEINSNPSNFHKNMQNIIGWNLQQAAIYFPAPAPKTDPNEETEYFFQHYLETMLADTLQAIILNNPHLSLVHTIDNDVFFNGFLALGAEDKVAVFQKAYSNEGAPLEHKEEQSDEPYLIEKMFVHIIDQYLDTNSPELNDLLYSVFGQYIDDNAYGFGESDEALALRMSTLMIKFADHLHHADDALTVDYLSFMEEMFDFFKLQDIALDARKINQMSPALRYCAYFFDAVNFERDKAMPPTTDHELPYDEEPAALAEELHTLSETINTPIALKQLYHLAKRTVDSEDCTMCLNELGHQCFGNYQKSVQYFILQYHPINHGLVSDAIANKPQSVDLDNMLRSFIQIQRNKQSALQNSKKTSTVSAILSYVYNTLNITDNDDAFFFGHSIHGSLPAHTFEVLLHHWPAINRNTRMWLTDFAIEKFDLNDAQDYFYLTKFIQKEQRSKILRNMKRAILFNRTQLSDATSKHLLNLINQRLQTQDTKTIQQYNSTLAAQHYSKRQQVIRSLGPNKKKYR